MDNVLLINENLIKSTSNIFENVAGTYLLPAIKIAQDLDLETIIGTNLLQELQSQIYNNRFKEDYKTLLDTYIQPYLVYSSIIRLIPIVSYKIGNVGVVTTSDEKMNPISSTSIDKVRVEYQAIADVYKGRLQKFLKANSSLFPELASCKYGEIKPNLHSTASCGIALGGAYGRISK